MTISTYFKTDHLFSTSSYFSQKNFWGFIYETDSKYGCIVFHKKIEFIEISFNIKPSKNGSINFDCNDYFFMVYATDGNITELHSCDSNFIKIDAFTKQIFKDSIYNSTDESIFNTITKKTTYLNNVFPFGFCEMAAQNIFYVRSSFSSLEEESISHNSCIEKKNETKDKSYFFDSINDVFTTRKLTYRDDLYISRKDGSTVICDDKFNPIDIYPIDVVISATKKHLIGCNGFLNMSSKSFIQFSSAPWSRQSIIGDLLYQFSCGHYNDYHLDIYHIKENSLTIKSTTPIPLNNIICLHCISPSVVIIITKTKSTYTVHKVDVGPDNLDWPTPNCDFTLNKEKSEKVNHLQSQPLLKKQSQRQLEYRNVTEFDSCLEINSFYKGQSKSMLGNRKKSIKNVPNEAMTGADYLDHMCILPVQIEHEAGGIDDYKSYFEQIFASSPTSKKVSKLSIEESNKNFLLKLTVAKKAYEVSFPIPDDSDLVSHDFFEAIEGILLTLFPEWTLCTYGSVGIVSRDALKKLLDMGAI